MTNTDFCPTHYLHESVCVAFNLNESSRNRHVTMQIWIEPVLRPDGRKHYTAERGLLLTARLGGPDGEIIVEGVHNAVCEACRVFMSRGVTGPFETWNQGIPYPCLRGDIEKTAGLTV